jgi:TRAP transporter 4TM/12TM fusion protein
MAEQSALGEGLSEQEKDELMAQFDKESAVRRFTGVWDKVTKGLLLAFAAYVMWVTLIAKLPERTHRAIFLGSLILIGYIFYPFTKSLTKKINHVAWYDLLLGLVGAGCFFYHAFNLRAIELRATMLIPQDIYIGVVGIIILAELCRRVVGFPILIVDAGFILYSIISGYSMRRVVHQLFYTTDGIIGTPIAVCSTFIVLFIFLASFLERSGIASFFIDLANSVAGWASGGPAKVAVIASALMGTYSGSSVANTVGSGSVTIPVMKKTGYKPEFAAAVEAAASTGGQIMPPIMGAAAFLMAELTGVSYPRIAVAAIFPAVLYFSGIFLNVHFEAKKLGLKGLPKEEIPAFFPLLARQGYLFLPVVVLVVLMAMPNGFTPAKAACFAILAAIVVSMFRKENRFTPTTFVEAVCNGSKNTIGVSLACAMAGIVIGIVSLTGIGQILIGSLMAVAGKSLFLALFLTMFACIVLGMGIPTTANYVIMATITAPIVIGMAQKYLNMPNFPILAAHMFVFYFGIVADITPPVALAAYAGSAIAKSNPMKTGVTATRLALAAFIIPYMFVYSPAMLLYNVEGSAHFAFVVITIIVSALLGMFGVATGLSGFMFAKMNILQRLMAVAGGLCLIKPGIKTDITGLVLIAIVVAWQLIAIKKAKAKAVV